MPTLIATKRLRYPRGVDGKEYNAGDSFEALSERDAKALTLVGAAKANAPKAAAAPAKSTISTRAMMPATAPDIPDFLVRQEPPQAAAPRDETEPPTYRRRDLRAED